MPVLRLGDVVAVDAGNSFSLGMPGDGTVSAWGGNLYGQLGDGGHEDSWATEKTVGAVHGLGDVTAVAAAGAHALALLSDRAVMAWGTNQDGELGNGEGGVERVIKVNGREARLVPGLTDVVAVAAGGGSDYALLRDGTIKAWGRNGAGQLGIGETGPETCLTEVGDQPCSTVPRTVRLSLPRGVRVKAISAGGEAGYALLTNHHVLAWGSNSRGQLGTGAELTPDHAPAEVHSATGRGALAGVLSVAGGEHGALALLASRRVVGWGANVHGGLGEPSGELCQKDPCDITPRLIAGLSGVSSIAAGAGYSLAVKAGRVYSFGANFYGQLGNGTRTDSPIPTAIPGLKNVGAVAAGNLHALALLKPGQAPPPPLVSAIPEPGSLEIAWTVPAGEYRLRWKAASAKSYGRFVDIKADCSAARRCRHLIEGLSAQPYVVEFDTYNDAGKFDIARHILITPLP